MPTAIKDFKIKESYFKLIDNKLFSYLWEGIFKPMFEIMEMQPDRARNDLNIIETALNNGDLYYVNGAFYARRRFSNAQSLMLQKWGAVYDKWQKTWRLPESKLPDFMRVSIARSADINAQKLKQLTNYLQELQGNVSYIVDSMVFNDEVVTILDDAGNEVKKNVKRINMITPELTAQQKQAIAQTYTDNIKDYAIKDFNNKLIPEMRQKVQEAVLNGARRDVVQKMLEQEYGIASRKAKFLARNETCIMLAEYKKVTYQEVGFDSFIWNTITDGRERELHKKLNGTTWRFDNPPIIDERTGQKGLPGETYNCRCNLIPVRSDIGFKMSTQKFNKRESEERIDKYIKEWQEKQAEKRKSKGLI